MHIPRSDMRIYPRRKQTTTHTKQPSQNEAGAQRKQTTISHHSHWWEQKPTNAYSKNMQTKQIIYRWAHLKQLKTYRNIELNKAVHKSSITQIPLKSTSPRLPSQVLNCRSNYLLSFVKTKSIDYARHQACSPPRRARQNSQKHASGLAMVADNFVSNTSRAVRNRSMKRASAKSTSLWSQTSHPCVSSSIPPRARCLIRHGDGVTPRVYKACHVTSGIFT